MRICSAGRGEPERRRWRKFFARAVNCEHPVDGSPCGECDMCRNIASGAYMNVVEIDAASNNGVDNIRSIREEVEYRPAQGRYKVYIIDEVHMLSLELQRPLKDCWRSRRVRDPLSWLPRKFTRFRSRFCHGVRDMISEESPLIRLRHA